MTARLDIAQLYATIRVKGMDTAERGIGKLKGEIFGVKTALASLAAAFGVRQMGSSFLDAAVSVENYKTSLNAVIKDVKKTEQVFKDLNEWAAINPIDTTDAVEAFVALKTAAVENTMEAVEAAADLAAVAQTSVSQVARAIITAESDSLIQLGIQLDRTGKTAIIRSGQIRVEVEKDIDSVRRGLVELMQKQFGGSMEATKNNWRGMVNTMSGMWTKFRQDVMGDSSSGGPFSALSSRIREIRDQWDSWAKTDDYKKTIQGIQTKLLGLLDTLSDVGSSFASVFSFAKDHVEGLTLALKTSLGVLVAYKAALLAIPITAFLANMGAWISLAPLAIKSFSSMATWLSLIGVSLSGPVALAVGAGVALFIELKDQMKRSAEKAKLLSDAMVTVNDKFSIANKSTLNLLEAEIDKTTKKIAELKEEMQEATKEALRLSTAQFMSRNGSLGGKMGGSTAPFREALFKEMADTDAELKAWLQALNKRSDEIKKSIGGVTTPPPSGDKGDEDPGPSSSLKSSESAVSRMVSNMRDQMKYLNIDGETFLGTLDKWMAKLKPLSDDWKKIADVRMEILGDKAEAEAERIAKAAEKVKEAQTAAAQGIDKFWSEMRWSYQEGFTSGDDLLEIFRRDFEGMKKALSEDTKGLLDMSDSLNWTDDMRARFSEIQALAGEMASSQLTALNQQLQNGLITQQQWKTAVEELKTKYGELPKVVEEIGKSAEGMAQGAGSGLSNLNRLTEQWVMKFQDGMANAIVAGEGLTETLQSIGREIASMIIKLALFGKKGTGGLLGGLFDGLHSGGIVGKEATFRRKIHIPIPKMHSGGIVGNDEQLTILQKGEGVFTKGQMAAMGGAGTTIINNYYNYIQAIDTQSFADACSRNSGAITGVVAKDYTNNGVTRRVMKGS
nr:hypothetical protein [uncultured Dethiosulfovibrio sp.]